MKTQTKFVELLCRTHYSFLRGASHPAELVNRAIELGYPALGVCDYDGVYGMPKAYLAVKQARKEGLPKEAFKLITGALVTLEGLPALNLIATDRAGYGLLCRILTR